MQPREIDADGRTGRVKSNDTLQRHPGDYPQATAEGEAGILLPDTCGFGKWTIDIRLALAETYLLAGDARTRGSQCPPDIVALWSGALLTGPDYERNSKARAGEVD